MTTFDIDEWVGPGSAIRRLARLPRRTEATIRRWLRPWIVVVAVGLDPTEELAHRSRAIDLARSSQVVWVTDTPTLGRTWPAAWVVHRISPGTAPADVVPRVHGWTQGSMRIRRTVMLTVLAGPDDLTGALLGA